MLYISHRFPEVFANCDALTVLRDGKHVKTLSMSSTRESRGSWLGWSAESCSRFIARKSHLAMK